MLHVPECAFRLFRGTDEIRQRAAAKVGVPSTQVLLAISEAEELMRTLFGELPPSPDKAAGECRTAAKLLQDFLSKRSISSELLVGYVRVAEKDWLEHYLSLIRVSDAWICADFSAAQIPWFKGAECVAVSTSPNVECLEVALQQEYRWWISSSKS
jgi:hypothetical protein